MDTALLSRCCSIAFGAVCHDWFWIHGFPLFLMPRLLVVPVPRAHSSHSLHDSRLTRANAVWELGAIGAELAD